MSSTFKVPLVFDGSLSLASAVRRTILSKCRTIAIDTVCILFNDSVMTDEQLAHRLGMMLLDDANTECDGEISLDVTASESDRRTVTTADLVFERATLAEGFDVPLLMLGPGQRVSIKASLRRSNGSEHSRFSPVATVGYQPRTSDVVVSMEPTGATTCEHIKREAMEYLASEIQKMNCAFEQM